MAPAERPAGTVTGSALALGRRAAAAGRALPGQPWSVLGLLIAVQWGVLAAFALTVRHNGWLFYQGGDQTWYYTSSWALSDGQLPYPAVGWGWPFLLTPISLVAGHSIVNALPGIVLLQAVVLGPALLVAVHSLGTRIGGRAAGAWSAAFFIAAPFVAILGFDPRYHDRWVEQFLPQALGLTGLSDFAAMVFVTVAAALLLRAIQEREGTSALLGGLVAGFALGIKPSTAPFLAGALLAVLVARRLKVGVLYGLALVPGLVVLAVWKQRGLGEQPLFALEAARLAAGAHGISLPVAGVDIGHYLDIDWKHMNDQFISLREFFWSPRLLEALPLAGAIAVARRSLPAAALLVGWFGAYFLAKAGSPVSTVDSGSIWRMLLPALPAYVLLVAAVPLLVPRGLLRAGGSAGAAMAPRPAARPLPRPRLLLGATAVVLGLAPLLLVGTVSRIAERQVLHSSQGGLYVTVDPAFGLRATVEGTQVRLAWRRPGTAGTSVFYRVVRSRDDLLHCTQTAGIVADCTPPAQQDVLDPTRAQEAVDAPPGGGVWHYGVQLWANWRDDPSLGDMLLVSVPVTVTVPGT